MLETLGIITKQKLPNNKKENIYLLTNKGIDLAPLILEIVLWSDKHVRAHHASMNPYDERDLERSVVIDSTQMAYREFVGQVLS